MLKVEIIFITSAGGGLVGWEPYDVCVSGLGATDPPYLSMCVCVCVSVQSFIWDFCTNAVLKIVIDARWVASLADASCLYF